MSRHMNQIYFEYYEFDIKVVRILIATEYLNVNVVMSKNESEYIVKFQYC